jgi:hypothetical protein
MTTTEPATATEIMRTTAVTKATITVTLSTTLTTSVTTKALIRSPAISYQSSYFTQVRVILRNLVSCF